MNYKNWNVDDAATWIGRIKDGKFKKYSRLFNKQSVNVGDLTLFEIENYHLIKLNFALPEGVMNENVEKPMVMQLIVHLHHHHNNCNHCISPPLHRLLLLS